MSIVILVLPISFVFGSLYEMLGQCKSEAALTMSFLSVRLILSTLNHFIYSLHIATFIYAFLCHCLYLYICIILLRASWKISFYIYVFIMYVLNVVTLKK